MKENLEDILDKALLELKTGASLDAVLFNFAEYKEELLPLLEIIQPGIKLPIKEVPKPALQRKYLTTAPQISLLNKYLSFTRLALLPLSVVLVFGATFTAGANPGQPLLYGFKQAVRKAPLALIRNPDARAAKQLELSEQNLNDAEAFLISDHENTAADVNVVTNLAKQTSATVASVKDVATSSAISGKNNDLLNKLVAITQKQEKLINTVKAPEDKPETTTALEQGKNETTKTVAEVNKLVATVNEQVLANLKEQAAPEEEKPAEATKASAEKIKTDKPISTKPQDTTDHSLTPDSTDPDVQQVSGTFILEYPNPQ